jgi:hypothetical protein
VAVYPGGRVLPANVGDWSVTVKSFQANHSSKATAVSDYNRKPGTGYVYAIYKIKATFRGAGQGSPSDLQVAINDVSSIDSGSMCHIMSDGAEDPFAYLNTGQSASYRECIYLLSSKTKKGTIGVSDGFTFEGGRPVFWAIP